MANTTNTFQADIFVIPNNNGSYNPGEWPLTVGWNEKIENFGINLPKFEEGDAVLQVWITSPEEDNWNDHGTPDTMTEALGMVNEKMRPNYFPQYIPAKWFAGKKEGETVEMRLNNDVKLVLTMNQLKYRYRSFGRFEEVFSKVTK